jgi:RNA polymerase sigma factor (sigma-70 family)
LPPNFDARWKRAALAGDASAVDRLADTALGPLYRFCLYRVGRDCHVCEEVVQETLVRALADLEKYEPDRAGGNIFPWLTGLARNEIHRALAKERNAASLEMFWQRMDDDLRKLYGEIESAPLEEDLLRRTETREMVGATMSQLPEHYRHALEAKYVLGKSVREIATQLATTEKAIESQLTRARQAFRATFLALAGNSDARPNDDVRATDVAFQH